MPPETAAPKPVKLVGAVVQAVRLLQSIERHEQPMGVSALARAADVNPSTAFNILRTLHALDFVTIDPASKTYSLGSGLLRLSEGLFGQSIVEAIRADIDRLATETNSFVGIWQITHDRLVLIDRAISNSPMRLDLPLKHRMPLMLGSLGRAYAANLKLSDAKLRAAFKWLRWEDPVDAARYIAEVRAAETVGYGVDRETLYRGVVSIGVIIKDRTNTPVYGLTASIINNRFSESDIPAIGERMAKLAQTFSR